MKMIRCPYCGERASLADIEEEGGECPYCGVLLEDDNSQKSSKLRRHKNRHEDDFDDEDDEWTKGYR